MEDWIILEGGTQPIIENPQDGQTQTETVTIDVHKNLQGDYTRSRQDAIELATQLVEANPKALSGIKDERIKNAVAKQIYGFDTYNQLLAVRGENFYQSSDDENLDKTTMLEREVRMLKYASESTKLDSAINTFAAQNKEIFASNGAEEKLRNELKYISSELPLEERIKRASQIAFATIPNANSVYKQIAVWTSTNWGNGTIVAPSAKESEIQIQIEAWRKLLGLA